MKAKLLYKTKAVDEDGFIIEMIIWKLPAISIERPHGLKYRLYFGDALGNGIVRYDNESGKGDHKHIGEKEHPYQFVTVEKLITDFMTDIEQLTHMGRHHD